MGISVVENLHIGNETMADVDASTPALVVIDGSGNVGIGTTTMTQFVNITSSSNSTTIIQLKTADGSETMNLGIGGDIGYIYMESNSALTFGTNGGEKMRIDSSGDVGIGTATPVAKLSVTGASAAANDIGIFQVTTGTGAHTDTKLTVGVVDNDYAWVEAGTPGTAVRDFVINPRGSGNVGIGVVAPVAHLQVERTSGTTFALSNSDSLTSGNRGDIAWYNSDVSTVATIRATAVTDNVGTELQFYTRPAGGSLLERFVIESDGSANFYRNYRFREL